MNGPDGIDGTPGKPASLRARIREFTESLQREFSERIASRPEAFKRRVVVLVKLNLPPFPKSNGRPRHRRSPTSRH
jgi:hypothetical protein